MLQLSWQRGSVLCAQVKDLGRGLSALQQAESAAFTALVERALLPATSYFTFLDPQVLLTYSLSAFGFHRIRPAAGGSQRVWVRVKGRVGVLRVAVPFCVRFATDAFNSVLRRLRSLLTARVPSLPLAGFRRAHACRIRRRAAAATQPHHPAAVAPCGGCTTHAAARGHGARATASDREMPRCACGVNGGADEGFTRYPWPLTLTAGGGGRDRDIRSTGGAVEGETVFSRRHAVRHRRAAFRASQLSLPSASGAPHPSLWNLLRAQG